MIPFLFLFFAIGFAPYHPNPLGKADYNAGFAAACNDVKSGIKIWDQEGFLSDTVMKKYSAYIMNNHEWFSGYRDGAICTHIHTPQYNAGFKSACTDKKAGIIDYGGNGTPNNVPEKYGPSLTNDKSWVEGYYDGASDTSFCPSADIPVGAGR